MLSSELAAIEHALMRRHVAYGTSVILPDIEYAQLAACRDNCFRLLNKSETCFKLCAARLKFEGNGLLLRIN